MTKLIIAALVFTAQVAFAQDIPKHSNQIIVKNVTMDKIMNTLLDNNYHIDKQDTVHKYISTVAREGGAGSYILYIRVKDSTAFVTGTYNANFTFNLGTVSSQSENWEIEWHGEKAGSAKRAFVLMDNFAKKLGTDIAYAIVK